MSHGSGTAAVPDPGGSTTAPQEDRRGARDRRGDVPSYRAGGASRGGRRHREPGRPLDTDPPGRLSRMRSGPRHASYCSPRATIVATWCSGTAVSACVAAAPRRVWSMTRPAGGCPVRPPDCGRSCACSKPCALCDCVRPSLFARDSTAECGRHHLQDEVRSPESVASLLDILRAVAGGSPDDRAGQQRRDHGAAPLHHRPAVDDGAGMLRRRGARGCIGRSALGAVSVRRSQGVAHDAGFSRDEHHVRPPDPGRAGWGARTPPPPAGIRHVQAHCPPAVHGGGARVEPRCDTFPG